ncbi:MAG: glutamate--cysteine ligase [Planctomycetes bacterium]|nr:glutamate--cysteine ligase [Planctomycetota bacterium]
MTRATHALFEVWGIEIEYMIVDADTLAIRAIADQLLHEAAGAPPGTWVDDVDDGPIGWSNELVAHLIEVKNTRPSPTLDGLAGAFHDSVTRANSLLAGHGAQLMPTAMHPFMDPRRETRIWPHQSAEIYQAYHTLFDCHRHGWANLQSVHLNLPFDGEQEFGRLMAAVRLVLPLIPALAASSPLVEGRFTGSLDNRIRTYRTNAERIPAMAGEVIPEPVFTIAEYHRDVLQPISRQLEAAGANPELLDQEWTNARGAIARFDRDAIEVRLIDAQECPTADLAVAAAVGGAIKALVEERWASDATLRAFASKPLVELLGRAAERGPHTTIGDPTYARLFGMDGAGEPTLGALWTHLAEHTWCGPTELRPHLELVLQHGTLAERIARGCAPGTDSAWEHAGAADPEAVRRTYRALCACLGEGTAFAPTAP